MLSIFLIGLIVAYLYGTLGELKNSNDILQKRDEQIIKEERFINLLRRDLFDARSVSITETGSKNSLLQLKTKNSLYNSGLTNVLWFLNTDENLIIRAESVHAITIPVPLEKEHLIRFEPFSLTIKGIDKIGHFKIYQSKDQKNILIAIQPLTNSMISEEDFYIRSLPINTTN